MSGWETANFARRRGYGTPQMLGRREDDIRHAKSRVPNLFMRNMQEAKVSFWFRVSNLQLSTLAISGEHHVTDLIALGLMRIPTRSDLKELILRY